MAVKLRAMSERLLAIAYWIASEIVIQTRNNVELQVMSVRLLATAYWIASEIVIQTRNDVELREMTIVDREIEM